MIDAAMVVVTPRYKGPKLPGGAARNVAKYEPHVIEVDDNYVIWILQK